jgi:hypothetical protein
MLAGNAAGGLACLLTYGFAKMAPNAAWVATYPSLLYVPFAIGLTAAWIWRPLKLRAGGMLLHSVSCTVVGLALAFLILREGAVCLLIASPIIYIGTAGGALVGRTWFWKKDRDGLNFYLAPLLLFAIASEPQLRGPHEGVVTDEIRIAAPPAKVWPHVLAFPEIREAPHYWLFRVGLPYPVDTTNGGNFVGADRACRFSGGAVFKEKVAELVPGQRLTFDIVEVPQDPELIGHLDAHRGQFELLDNGDGTTTLIGRTWYSLRVRPAVYFDWWTHDIFRAVHLRVMRHIQQLSENGED